MLCRTFFDKFKDRITFFECDLASAKELELVCHKIGEKAGKIDVLVNNAAISSTKWIENRSVDEWDEVINVNLRAPYLMVKFLLPYLKEGASIVNIASTRSFDVRAKYRNRIQRQKVVYLHLHTL